MARRSRLLRAALLLASVPNVVAQEPGYESPQVYPSREATCLLRLGRD